MQKAGLWGEDQKFYFPVITKQGINEQGKTVHYFFNYSAQPNTITYPYKNSRELLQDKAVNKSSTIALEPWDVKIIEEQ